MCKKTSIRKRKFFIYALKTVRKKSLSENKLLVRINFLAGLYIFRIERGALSIQNRTASWFIPSYLDYVTFFFSVPFLRLDCRNVGSSWLHKPGGEKYWLYFMSYSGLRIPSTKTLCSQANFYSFEYNGKGLTGTAEVGVSAGSNTKVKIRISVTRNRN